MPPLVFKHYHPSNSEEWFHVLSLLPKEKMKLLTKKQDGTLQVKTLRTQQVQPIPHPSFS